MTKPLSIDDKIHGITPTEGKPDEEYVKKETEDKDIEAKETEAVDDEKEIKAEKEKSEVLSEGKEDGEDKETIADGKEKVSSADEVDDYGIKVDKSERMYTEEEVQNMIRDRLSRGHMAAQQQPTQQQVQQAAQGFIEDPNSSDDWQTQLDAYIDQRLETRERTQHERAWQEQEREKQINFQAKFTTGMEKYSDFRDTVSKLPITDSMMMATREMKDPAAFVYAAAKQHPEDVKRIAAITDPYHQAAEIGRLEERMRKAARLSKASQPLSPTKSDYNTKNITPKRTLDDKIIAHAKLRNQR